MQLGGVSFAMPVARRKPVFALLAAAGVLFLFVNLFLLSADDLKTTISKIPLPGLKTASSSLEEEEKLDKLNGLANVDDLHPVGQLIKDADKAFNDYISNRSSTFTETVQKYRKRYGRHPPPGFKDWYKFARDRGVYNVDDFQQIMDDLRPFWGVKPASIRGYASHIEKQHLSGLHVRDGKIWKMSRPNWRIETFRDMVSKFVEYLPDMDLAMNPLDQPRVVVPWNDLQKHLQKEVDSRQLPTDSLDAYTKGMKGFFEQEGDTSTPEMSDPAWFQVSGQEFMKVAKEACPPGSHARASYFSASKEQAERLYKEPTGGFITNYNRSSDLCVVGPEIEDKHGLLYAPSMLVTTRLLVPVFGECKTNVNNDILFPANMYYRNDERYVYDAAEDKDWESKGDKAIWRGVTSGGVNTAENWRHLHRSRLALLTNSTELGDDVVRITTADYKVRGAYQSLERFKPKDFAKKYTDVAFGLTTDCWPDCGFFKSIWTLVPTTTLSSQFKNKYLIDVDGHSFSGRFRAFLFSKSLPIKATIFREWHDSRIFGWRHFVPFDNRFDDFYSVLTYFIGIGTPEPTMAGMGTPPYVAAHDFEARKIGRQGAEWAKKVLRTEDMEIYMFRLLLEYARIIDDNRDNIGYSGNGSELEAYDKKINRSWV